MRPVSSVSRHATSACLCLWVLACSPPIDADRCFDERCPPGTACVAGRCEASLTPDQDPPTADQGPDDGPDGGPDCTPIRPLTSAEPEALWASDLEEIARFGVPAPPEGFGAADLDGDGLADSVAVVGDRIQATDGARSLRWAVDAGGATALGGVVDLDGDGRLEVIAFGEGALQILDGLTGATVWALDVGGQRKALDGFQAVDVVRVGPRSAGGQRPVLVTDHGCGQQVGTTQAAILWLSEGAVTEVPLDLDSLVCARGAVFGRPGPQAELGVLLPTGNRLQQISQFDPHTGALRWCGRLPNGGTPRLQVVEVLPDRPGLEVLAHDSEGWLVYAAVEGAWVDCGQGGVVGPARSDFTDLFAGDPVVVFDPDGDGRPEIAGTALFDEETVYVGRPDPMAGEPADFAQIFGRRLVGAGYGPDDLILWRRPDPDFFFQLGATERVIFDDGDPGTVWGPREHTRPARLTGPGGPPDRDPEGERPVWLRHPDGARLILEGDGDADGVVDHLLAVDAAGDVVGRRPVAGAPVAYQVVCEASACDTTDGLLVLTADGDVQALSAALAPAAAKAGGPPAPPVAGAITLRLTPDDEPTLVVGVQASAADPRYVRVVGQDPLSGHRWSLPLDFETLPPVVLPHPDLGARVAVRQVQGRTVTWRVLDPVSGAELWEHTVRNRQVAPAPLVPLPAGDGSLVLRLDAPTGSPQEGCPQAVLPPADPGGCAVVPPNRRVTALDVADGTCRWQLDYTLSTPCAANLEAALERLSVVPGEGDTLELYLTESTAVHRLAPSTGAWLGSASLAPPGQGGALLRHPRVDLRLRLGAGPVDLWDRELRGGAALPTDADGAPVEAAAAGPEAVWFVRDGQLWQAAADDGVQVTLAPAAVLAGRLTHGVAQGVAVRSLTRAAGLGPDGGDGVVAATADHLLALTRDSQQSWSRTLPGPGAPWTGDLDGDGALDLVLAVGDGRVLRATRRTLSPPTEIAVVPCPVAQACEGAGPQPLGSLDTADGATLCARFRPVAEADGHEARLVGPDGTPLTAWTPAGAGILTLPLAAARPARERGAPHTVEVRAWASGDGQRPTSAPGQGAPVLIRDRAAPQATLRVSGERDRVPAGTPLTLLVDAQDDHLVASARVELVGGDDTVWWAADVGAVALPQVAAAVGWDGQGGQPLGPVPPGAYTLRLRVGDLAGEGVTVTLGLILCDGPCE